MDRSSTFSEIVLKHSKLRSESKPTRSILPNKKGPITRKALEVVATISSLNKFLHDVSKDYINAERHLSGRSSSMTDKERDDMETQTKILTNKCCKEIDYLKHSIGQEDIKKYYNESTIYHLSGVVLYLYNQLQQVTDLFSYQRALRFKNLNEKEGYFKVSLQSTATDLVNPPSSVEDELQLDEAERKMLEEENMVLHNKLQSTVDQAREIEKKIMEISELQNIFAAKVAQQSEEIEMNYQLVLQAKANVDKGTDALLQATKSGVDFRTFVLLFLIITGLALLFLNSITP